MILQVQKAARFFNTLGISGKEVTFLKRCTMTTLKCLLTSILRVSFYSVFTDSNASTTFTEVSPCYNSLSELTISESDVFTILKELDISKASGHDGIGPNILRNCSVALYQPLCHLFQMSLKVHKLPDEWKLHSIKNGDRSNVKKLQTYLTLKCQ